MENALLTMILSQLKKMNQTLNLILNEVKKKNGKIKNIEELLIILGKLIPHFQHNLLLTWELTNNNYNR